MMGLREFYEHRRLHLQSTRAARYDRGGMYAIQDDAWFMTPWDDLDPVNDKTTIDMARSIFARTLDGRKGGER